MAVKNLVSGVLAQSITTSTTNILVNVAQGISASEIQSFFPTPPFYITIMPKSPTVGVANRLDSEILRVTAVGSDQSGNATLTCVRGQRDTTAKAFSAGDIVTVGIYADDAVFLGSEGSAVGTPAPWVDNSDIKNGAITTDKIADNAITSDKVNWATMSYVSIVGGSVIDVTQTVTTLCEATIPKTGVYFVSATVDANLLALDVGNATVFLALNDSDIPGARVFFNNNGRDWFMGGATVSAIVSCKKGDKIRFRGQSGLNKWQAGDRRRLDAFRIG